MKTRILLPLLGIFGVFWPLAPVSIAQTAIYSGASASALPLRNLLIEVRQVQSGASQQSGLGAQGSVRLESDGQVALQGQVLARQQQTQQSATALQQVLVLNGRSADIALRNSSPVRLLQSFVRDGRVFITQGVVFLQSGTGFAATPRWDGTELVELTLSARQAMVQPGRSAEGISQSSASSTLVIPLGEWTTVAQTEGAGDSATHNTGGNTSAGDQRSTEVQVRITVR